MDDQVLGWLRGLKGNAGLSPGDAAGLAAKQGLPQDYAAFLREHDGAEGFIGESYVCFYGSTDFARATTSPQLDHLAELAVFGSNGAGEAFAFDRTRGVVVSPWIGSPEDAIAQGSFTDFVRRLHEGSIFERE